MLHAACRIRAISPARKRARPECKCLHPRTTPVPSSRSPWAIPPASAPELTVKAIALPEVREAADIIVIGDSPRPRRRARGPPASTPDSNSAPDFTNVGRPASRCSSTSRTSIPRASSAASATRTGGEFALANFRTALELAARGRADAVCFTPFNKEAMRSAHPGYDDEIGFVGRRARHDGPGERVQRARRTLECARDVARAAVATSPR